jgi:transaldolase
MSAIGQLLEFGQSPWYDNLTRAYARGGLQQLINDGIRGVTSNPTIFEKAMAAGNDYDEQLASLARAKTDTKDAYWDLVLDDIEHAADLLRPVFDEAAGDDGYVSIEVDPDLAMETGATTKQAADLFNRVARPNVFIKIPATREGLPAIEDSIAIGININITLIFSLARYDEVIDAYMRGLERLAHAGGDVSQVASVASFFVSRVDTETDRRLPEGHALRGKAAVANAKLAYEQFQQRFSGARWDALAAQGARLQRPLWASTSTKNPAYSPTLYVDELIGAHTVNTLAQASIDALRDHTGLRADTVMADVAGARQVMTDLAAAGVDIDDVTATLEREGVAAFSASFHDALDTLEKKARELAS